MLDAKDLLKAIKKAAVEAVEASQPTDFCFGEVLSTSPLKIKIEQKLTLGKAQLIMTERTSRFSPLETGDGVVLLKKKGGQKYLILDKVVDT